MLIRELKILEKQSLLGRRNEMLIHQSLSELLLIVSELIFIEVELVIGWDVGWSELLGKDCFGVDAAYPRMEEDFFQALQRSYPHFWVFMKETGKKVLDFTRKRDMLRESQLFIHYCIFDLLFIPRIKRRQSRNQLVEQSPQRVKVHTVRMPSLLYHLRRHVLGTPTETISDIPAIQPNLRQPKICNLDMPIMIDQQIFRLKIPIYDILLMEIHQPIEDLNEIKPRMFFSHSLHSLQVIEQLSARTIYITTYLTIQNEAYEVVSLETVIQLDDKWMIQHRTDRFLIFYDIFFLVVAYETFQHDFHGVKLAVSETTDQIDLAEAAYCQTFTDFVFFQSALRDVFQAVERSLLREDALADRDLIIQQQILLDGLKSNDLSSLKQWILIPHVQQVPIDLLMEDKPQVFGLDSSWQLHFQQDPTIVQCDYEEGRRGDDGWRLRVELAEILLGPLIDPF